MKYQQSEPKSIFSEKEFIIRSNGKMRGIKISSRFQVVFFILCVSIGLLTIYSYKEYTLFGKIISDQEQQLGNTRSAYENLMTDFMSVHKNISSLVVHEDKKESEVDEYLKKAQVIEEKIKQITEREDWVSKEEIENKVDLKDAIIYRDVVIEEKKILEEKVMQLEDVINSLQAFELDILKKIETVSIKEIDDIKNSISTINKELKKRGEYYNPLANSKKNNKGGLYEPDNMAINNNYDLKSQVLRTFDAVDDYEYYKDVVKQIPFGKPVWTYWVSSPFGKRSDPFNKKSAIHKGVDLAENVGNKIKTMADGKVLRAGINGGYGKFVEIDHGNGFKTKYGHLNRIYVSKGDVVKQGDGIGEVGNTGRSTGPHLHYEILYRGVHLDPMVFIKAI